MGITINNIPLELTARRQWVGWRYETSDGKTTKVPKNPKTGGNAITTEPNTWAGFREALSFIEKYRFDGVGFVFSEADPFTGIDLDKCLNRETGELEPWARKWVDLFDSYTETSPSGKGLHTIIKARKPDGFPHSKKGPFEVYDRARFLTFTGHVFEGRNTIRECQSELEACIGELWPNWTPDAPAGEHLGLARIGDELTPEDEKLLEAARSGPDGAKFRKLYDAGEWDGLIPDTRDTSPSGADLTLCVMLIELAGQEDPARIDRLFQNSALCRDKWMDREYYRRGTLAKALEIASRPKCEKTDFHLDDLILTDTQLIGLSIPEKRSFLAPWLNECSIISVVAWRGVGKSLFTWSAVDAITKGRSLGPWRCDDPVNCLIVDGEMAVQDGQRRLADLGTTGRKAELLFYSDHYIHSQGRGRANLLNEKWRGYIAGYMLRHNIKVWICDNLASLAPGIDENSKGDWDAVNQWFLELRFKGISTIIVHHEGKGGTQRGTSAREDNLDVCISLKQPADYTADQGARFIAKFTKSRIPHEYLHLIADHEFVLETAGDNYKWAWSRPTKEKKAEILRLSHEGKSVTEIAEEVGVAKSYASKIRTKAINDGILNKDGKLTPIGSNRLNRLEGEQISEQKSASGEQQ
jgi:hypothetical protein